MSLPTATKQWIVAEKPVGDLSDKVRALLLPFRLVLSFTPTSPPPPSFHFQTFELKEVALPELKDGQILVQSKFMFVPLPLPPAPVVKDAR